MRQDTEQIIAARGEILEARDAVYRGNLTFASLNRVDEAWNTYDALLRADGREALIEWLVDEPVADLAQMDFKLRVIKHITESRATAQEIDL